jgi:HK97 family phage major capsid protein
LKQAPVRTLAHIFKVSRQILDDAPSLASYINKRGTFGLKTVEETQLLTGNGTGQNLNGIVPQASDYETARNATGDDELQVLLHAISQAEEAEAPVTGIVISKKKWRDILGIRDNEGRYLSSGPFASTAPKIWDLPVAASNAMGDDDFLVGSFGSGVGAQIFDRMAVEVLLSSENSDDFEKNMLTVRIEERIALAVYRPEAFVYGSFS